MNQHMHKLFKKDIQMVKCIRVSTKEADHGRPKPMRVYGCPSSSVAVSNSSGFFEADGSRWEMDVHCIRFDDAILEEYHRPQPVKLRTDCLFPINLEAAQLAVANGEKFDKSPRLSCFCLQQANEDPYLRIPGYYKTPTAEAAGHLVIGGSKSGLA
eukprot:Skav228401  [mRNA]  locus=scaffold1911:229849:235764:+ [translate_table: standard]